MTYIPLVNLVLLTIGVAVAIMALRELNDLQVCIQELTQKILAVQTRADNADERMESTDLRADHAELRADESEVRANESEERESEWSQHRDHSDDE